MVRFKRSKRLKRLRGKRGRFVKRRRRLRVPRQMALVVPQTMVTKLRYYHHGDTLDPGIAGTVGQTFSTNSLFDPDVTGGGHQPMGFDQFANFYKQYTVLGAKISTTFICRGGDSGGVNQYRVGVFVDDVNSLTHTVDNIIELGRGPSRVMSWANGGRGVVTMSRKWSAKKYFKVATMRDSDWQTLFTASPAKRAYFHVWAAGVLAADNPAALVFSSTIDYICKFTERVELAQS